ncbi:MAG TPA: L-fucose:H+ symporter permease [Gemmatimonadaceae bacterium]|nr:L-fucose:H+ symporter permease [Gemmatimonadaceae bacterium]
MTTTRAPFTERRFVLPLILVTSLFFLWALGVNLNDILIPHLKKAFGLTDFQSSLIQTAFFGGYFVAALPAGWVMRRLGYRGGILTGLVTCATGAFLFIPASSVRAYPLFLLALFVLACGQCFLEVGANPYVTTLGDRASASWRLNTAQAFNAICAAITPFIGARFILSGIEHTSSELAAMSPAELESYRAFEAGLVRMPYLVIMGIFLFVAFLIWRAHLPEVRETEETPSAAHAGGLRDAAAHGHLMRGVIAQFLYVGAQVGVASFVIRFVQHTMPGTPEKHAASFLGYHQAGFLLGRLLSVAALSTVPAPVMLALFAAGALAAGGAAVAAHGALAVWMIVLLGFFHSLMFPTIFALSIEGLGRYTKLGSSLLVMSIVGGAIIPAVMGRLSDATSIQTAFVVPIVCYAYVLYFAMRGHRPSAASVA